MAVFDSLKKLLGNAGPEPAHTPAASPPPAPAPRPAPAIVPEVGPAELVAELNNGGQPLLLDCREHYERQQNRIPNSLHIPMNQIPARLDELDKEADIVVYCAHGVRSYDVAGYLIRNGFTARSLAGGIATWYASGGQIEQGFEPGS